MRFFRIKFILACFFLTGLAFAKSEDKTIHSKPSLSSGLADVWNHVTRQCRLIFLEPEPAPYLPTVTTLVQEKSVPTELLKSEVWWSQTPYPLQQKIHPFFRGEQYGAAIHPQFQNKKIRYLTTAEERSSYLLRFHRGLVVDQELQRQCPEACRGIYVMSSDGVIYFRQGHDPYEFHHSSFLAGAPVAAAGEIIIENGRIVMVNNRSGHYRASFAHIFQFLLELQKKKVRPDYQLEFYDMIRLNPQLYDPNANAEPQRKIHILQILDGFKLDWAKKHIAPVPWEMLLKEF
jgi:hypothetical protein